ncbi:hypothetical protein F4818DRAFT_42377 [Hypoxylon cercidicola]|nr:hypothetical protein F4818DRAFT_42377 [Hypoxylon cercidicola]
MDTEYTDYIPQANSSDNEASSSRESALGKRRRRTAEPPHIPPLKRQKGTLHPKYVTLLNGEIADASTGIVKDPDDSFLGRTQVGAVVWTAAEKQAYFSAVARLGRDDSAGITARIGTKSVLEVRQYTMLLEGADRARRSDADRVQRAPRTVDIPAAAELSTELCLALEAAADDLSVRQEMHETRLEQKRWANRWLVTESLVPVLEHQLQQPEHRPELLAHMPFAELFHLGTWLRLSARVFMNSAVVPDGNWRCASGDPPAVRTTALGDFHALALSVTRRLVATALFIAHSRIRAKQAGDRRHRVGALVKAKDVQAAVASVGLKENNREFWARAPRRLRLDVYDDYDSQSEASPGADAEQEEKDNAGVSEKGVRGDEFTDINDPDADNDENEEEQDVLDQDNETNTTYEPDILSYDEVEAALGFPNPHTLPPKRSYDILPDVSSTSSESDGSDQDVSQPEAESPGPEVLMEDEDQSEEQNSDLDADLVARDVEEATEYSSLYCADTARARQAIARGIRAQLRLEAEADKFDSRTGAREEARLWGMLRRGDDYEEKGGEVKPKPASGMPEPGLGGEVDGGNWRDHTEYYGEWEFDRRATSV